MKPTFSETRLRAKNRVTVPASIMTQANVREGDALRIEFSNGSIVLTPVTKLAPEYGVMKYAGILKGAWGDTPDRVNDLIQEIRDGRGR